MTTSTSQLKVGCGANARCLPKLLTSIDTGSAVHEMEGLPSAWEMTLTRDPEKRLISDLFTKPWRWTFGIGITGKDQMQKAKNVIPKHRSSANHPKIGLLQICLRSIFEC